MKLTVLFPSQLLHQYHFMVCSQTEVELAVFRQLYAQVKHSQNIRRAATRAVAEARRLKAPLSVPSIISQEMRECSMSESVAPEAIASPEQVESSQILKPEENAH